MSSPFVRRIIIAIIRGFQAVIRYTAFVFHILWTPFRRIGQMLFRFLVLPIYQVLSRLKRATSKEGRTLPEILIGKPLLFIIIACTSISGIAMNILAPRSARGETVGQKTILFALTRDEETNIEETVLVTHQKRPPSYYTNTSPALFWKLATPLTRIDDTTPFQTTYGGSTLIAPQGPGAQTQITPIRVEPTTYTIRPGDTISTIAEKFGISVETILWENNLRATSLLRIGQQLAILPTTGISHRVSRNETLSIIARRYGVTTEEVQKQNGLTLNQRLTIGQILVIPGGRQQRIVVAPRVPSPIRTLRDAVVPSVSATIEKGRLFWPSTGRKINQYFTWSHNGLDIDGDYTSPIYAADDGVILVAGWGRGYGIHVDIDHGNGLKTRYGHSSKLFVRVGEHVKRGQLIGMVGSTGRSTGPHIHFEVIVKGRQVNPLNYTR